MTRTCAVCAHPQREQIDYDLLLHRASYRVIASRYGFTAMETIRRHELGCLARTYQQSQELRMKLSADNLTEALSKWHERMEDQYDKADSANDFAAIVGIARTGMAAIESFARIGLEADMEQRLAKLEEQIQEDNDGEHPAESTAFESA